VSAPILPARRWSKSPSQHLDARVKLVLALAFILTTALVPQAAWAVYLLLFSLVTSALILSELAPGRIYLRSLIALPFAFAALPLIFTLPGQAWFSMNLGQIHLTATTTGAVRALSILIKVWLSVQAGILLSATTPQTALLAAMRALKLPRLLVSVMGLMWRYLDLLLGEARRLMRARDSRSASSPSGSRRAGGSLVWRARVTGGMAGSLMLRSLERSERVYQAMLARGYDGEPREARHQTLTSRDRLVLSIGLLILFAMNLLAMLWIL
jgi:cobalt/nickel transport system permease protein